MSVVRLYYQIKVVRDSSLTPLTLNIAVCVLLCNDSEIRLLAGYPHVENYKKGVCL